MKVLVAEDNVLLAMTIQDELEEAGLEVIGPVATAAQADNLSRIFEIDVALVDIDLADGRTGAKLANLLSERGCSVVFMTGQAALARGHKSGALGVLAKPFDPVVVYEVVKAAIAHKNGDPYQWPVEFERFQTDRSIRDWGKR